MENQSRKSQRYVVIKQTVKRARETQRVFPQIADDYRRGLFCDQIAEKYKLIEYFGITGKNPLNSAIKIVSLSLSGLESDYEELNFEGLIPREEYVKIRDEHQNGNRYFQCINLNEKPQSREMKRKASLEALAAKNQSLWTQGELETALSLSFNPLYANGKGVDWKKISQELVFRGFPERAPKAVKSKQYKAKQDIVLLLALSSVNSLPSPSQTR